MRTFASLNHNKMKITITGSLGNISKPLTIELIKKGHEVTVISSKADKKKAIEALGAKAAIGSIEDVPFLTRAFTGADAVYCMMPVFDFAVDVMEETRRLIGNYCAAIRASGVKKVVHLSSIGAHTDQGNGLLAFHHLAEKLFRELPADVIIKHMRPVGFYNNMEYNIDFIKRKDFLGRFLALRFYGLIPMLRGQVGIIVANYGEDDLNPWVSPYDIAEATAEELTTPFVERKFRYVASEELTCNEIAKILGEAIGKPYLKWGLISDKEMFDALKSFKLSDARARGVVEMQAGSHTGSINEDYYRHRPVLGRVKFKDYAKDFAAVYNQK